MTARLSYDTARCAITNDNWDCPVARYCLRRADKVRALVEAAYRAGWDASGEGWNGEYPGNAHESDMWVSARAAALAPFTDGESA